VLCRFFQVTMLTAARASLQPTPGESRRRRILVAEDDSNLRSFLIFLLSNDGYDVVEASDGVQLGEYLAGHFFKRSDSPVPVDLIVTDVRMPGFTGLEILEELRRADRSTPVILMTGFGSEQLHEKARKLGAAATLDKPFEIDDLRMLVRLLVPLENSESGFGRSRVSKCTTLVAPDE
jgi:DNA-binding response OmpR family regulator